MAYILRTPDGDLRLSLGGRLLPPPHPPLAFHTPDAAYHIADSDPAYNGLVVDVVPAHD